MLKKINFLYLFFISFLFLLQVSVYANEGNFDCGFNQKDFYINLNAQNNSSISLKKNFNSL